MSPTGAPLVSVVLPVRDAAQYLDACVTSLRAQTLDDMELVVVDDGSRDASPDIVRSWAASDRRVRRLRQDRLGLVEALRRGCEAATGRYVARMDADDVAHPERLERQVALMESNRELVATGCGVRYFPDEAVEGGARRYETWLNGLVSHAQIERDLFVECPIAHPTFMLRTEALRGVGGYRDVGWPEDYDLLLRLWEAGGRFAKVPDVLLSWREGPDRLSRTSPVYAPDAFRRLKCSVLVRTRLVERAAVVWGAGPVGKAFARALIDVGATVRAFVDLDPRKIGQHIHGAPVIAPEDVERYRGCVCLAAVGQRGARADIRADLSRRGWSEPEEVVAVA